jgi:pilus assembly protein Flp/PilA
LGVDEFFCSGRQAIMKGTEMFAYCLALLGRIKASREGVTALEYGLLAGLIAAVIVTAVALLGTNISTVFNTIAGTI